MAPQAAESVDEACRRGTAGTARRSSTQTCPAERYENRARAIHDHERCSAATSFDYGWTRTTAYPGPLLVRTFPLESFWRNALPVRVPGRSGGSDEQRVHSRHHGHVRDDHAAEQDTVVAVASPLHWLS